MQDLAKSSTFNTFAQTLLTWFDQYGRYDLPWQVDVNHPNPDGQDAYRVWVSEVMLQQTQVKTVLHFFDRFLARFPSVQALGEAHWDEVAPFWAGLGYYARARNLHQSAGVVAAKIQQGQPFPNTLEDLMALRRIGQSTAGAILAMGLGQFGVILDGNVKRVLMRIGGIEGEANATHIVKSLWVLANELTQQAEILHRTADYTQAIMDFGATVCTPKNPQCHICSFNYTCQAFATHRVLDIPAKKIKVKNPERYAFAIMLRLPDGRLLWQQRPASGLWGGLWTLPLFEQDAQYFEMDQLDIYLNRFHLNVFHGVLGKQIKHVFTHFTWFIQTIILDVPEMVILDATVEQQWLIPEAAIQVGLPKAMRKLFE